MKSIKQLFVCAGPDLRVLSGCLRRVRRACFLVRARPGAVHGRSNRLR